MCQRQQFGLNFACDTLDYTVVLCAVPALYGVLFLVLVGYSGSGEEILRFLYDWSNRLDIMLLVQSRLSVWTAKEA